MERLSPETPEEPQPPEKMEINSQLEHERGTLEENLSRLGDNLHEIEESPRERREWMVNYLQNYLPVVTTLIGLGAGISSGNVEDFLLKTGTGVAFGLIGRGILKRGARQSAERLARKQERQENQDEAHNS